VTASATYKIADKLRDLGCVTGAAARRLSRPRVVATVVGITVLIAVATWIPLPSPVRMRDWAESVGPWFPLAFLVTHVVVTIVPVPRTAFTLATGLLFGPVLGVLIAVVASTTSAVIALLLVRAAGWRLTRLVRHQSVDTVNQRLRQRGWFAVLSLRLIPAVPFSALNYAAGASAVRVLPYTLATLGGLLPGTATVVILGDALAGHPSPLLYLVSVCTGALGLTGLVIETRHYRQHHRRTPQRTSPGDEPAAAPAAVS
jgi:uncharacterized membrane protein YdjX (TVP38/TMEM64 family)